MQYQTFHVLDWPEVPPGKCMICGANHRRDGRKYVDFGQNIPRYGAVYFCTICVGEAAQLIGYLNPELAAEIESNAETHRLAHDELKEENGRLRSALSELDFLGNIRDNVANDVADTESGTPDAGDTDNEPLDIVERREESESGPNEPSDERGSTDVYGIAVPVISDAF